MNDPMVKTEYQILKNEMRDFKKRLDFLENIIRKAQRKRREDEILAIAKEAERLAKEGKLPILRSLKELR